MNFGDPTALAGCCSERHFAHPDCDKLRHVECIESTAMELFQRSSADVFEPACPSLPRFPYHSHLVHRASALLKQLYGSRDFVKPTPTGAEPTHLRAFAPAAVVRRAIDKPCVAARVNASK